MVRVLESLQSSVFRAKLRAKIPKEAFKVPEVKHTYPQLLLSHLPKTYFDLGILTELLLQKKNVSCDDIALYARTLFDVTIPDKVLKAKSTLGLIEKIHTTQAIIQTKTNEKLEYNRELSLPNCAIVGHPDILTRHHVFEVKTSGRLKDSWANFIIQSFCYVALAGRQIESLHIVLPLQAHVETIDVSNWQRRDEFVALMMEYKEAEPENILAGKMLMVQFKIGRHIHKKPSLYKTVLDLVPGIPFQIFLSKTSKIVASDEDIAATLDHVTKKNLSVYVHAPYILNLCDTKDYIVPVLKRQLEVAAACGFKGVVVHVGKSVKLSISEALDNMKRNLREVLDADDTFNLFLETPAGQGSEVLTTCEEFMNFVCDVSPRLGACIDTCHVFAAGTMPDEYIYKLGSRKAWYERVKLIHFNDSQTDFGSRVDRHAMPGQGKIPFASLVKCAKMAEKLKVDMVFE
jgi:endonuclease IV